jgi:hypothetical protein
MHRLTARLLLVLLLAGIFVPVAMAVTAPLPHACCMRKPMHNHGSGSRDLQAVGNENHNCCPPVTTAQWADLESGVDSNIHSPLAYLAPVSHAVLHSDYSNSLQPVRGPPLG